MSDPWDRPPRAKEGGVFWSSCWFYYVTFGPDSSQPVQQMSLCLFTAPSKADVWDIHMNTLPLSWHKSSKEPQSHIATVTPGVSAVSFIYCENKEFLVL